MEVTIFRDIISTEQPFFKDVYDIFDRIRNGSSKNLIQRIRSEKDKTKRDLLKGQLPSICFSGKFNKRADASLVEHSGLICLDFDGYKTQTEMHNDKESFGKNKYVLSVFVSPSGKGLKVVVKVPADPESHKLYFYALENYFKSDKFDKSCSNVSRVCYESYDPLIIINPESETWETKEEPEYKTLHRGIDKDIVPITDITKVAKILIKWWENRYPMVAGSRNQHSFILAMAFNEYGVEKEMAKMIMSEYEDQDFTYDEIVKVIESAYGQQHKFNTKFYEDTEVVSRARERMRRGASKKEVRHLLEQSGVDGEMINGIIDRLEEESMEIKFWSKNDKGFAKIIPIMFKKFLENSGFFKYSPPTSTNYVFVKVTNNLIDNANEKEIKDFVLEYLLTLKDTSVYNYFAENTRYFKEEFLTLLSTIEVFFVKDTADVSYLYYRNCAVKVSKEGVEIIDYIDLGGYVWKDQIIDRIYTDCKYIGSDFEKFISNICASDKSRIKSMESTIGFLMHGFKNPAFCPSVILNDEVISDNPEGGTGKGLLMNGIGKMKKMVVIDGKSFDPAKGFPYQLVSADTQILCFDDVNKYFNFERLFSIITEGITLEKKNKDAIKIPFQDSPKIAITTNYAIKGAGNSFERRKWELELHKYYHIGFTPEDEFKKMMFSGWSEKEWCQFDRYMLNCLVSYMKTGFVKSNFINLKVRKLSAETSHEFIEWCCLIDNHKPSEMFNAFDEGKRVYKHELYDDFVNDYPDFAPKSKMSISRTRFNKWISSYCVYKTGSVPEEGRDTHRWVRMRSKHEMEEQTEIQF